MQLNKWLSVQYLTHKITGYGKQEKAYIQVISIMDSKLGNLGCFQLTDEDRGI